MRLAAIGDVHGERWKLASLLRKLPSDVRLVFLGDYVDRGPDVAGTLDLLLTLPADPVFLRGNHDQLMLDARDYFDPARESAMSFNQVTNWFTWGGAETVQSYRGEGPWYARVPSAHWEFLASTRLEYAEGPFLFVHAGVCPPGLRYEPMLSWHPDPRLWIRDEFIECRDDLGVRVVFGHTVFRRGPLVMPNKIGVDTGACFGGPLTAALLDTDRPEWVEFVQAA